jgi:hypothetical protein
MRIFFVISCALLILFPISQHQDILPTSGVELFSNALLLFGIYLVSPNKHLFAVSVLTSALAIVLIWSSKFYFSKHQLLFGLFLEGILFMIAIYSIILHVLTMRKINEDKIFGAISAYLLLCIFWALIYTMTEIYDPYSFSFSTGFTTAYTSMAVHRFYFTQFLYFSFITFSTLGYGDILPLTAPARIAASLQAVAGQLYVAILIARLVGLQIIQSQKDH